MNCPDCGNVLISKSRDNEDYICCLRCNYEIRINAYEPWYSPGSIIYNWEQNIWMITLALDLPPGEWPPETRESEGSNGLFNAPYETICRTMGELRLRLDRLPDDARTTLIGDLQGYYDSMKRLKRYEYLLPLSKKALNYISGEERKRQTYAQWQRDYKNTRKNDGKSLTKTNGCARLR